MRNREEKQMMKRDRQCKSKGEKKREKKKKTSEQTSYYVPEQERPPAEISIYI